MREHFVQIKAAQKGFFAMQTRTYLLVEKQKHDNLLVEKILDSAA